MFLLVFIFVIGITVEHVHGQTYANVTNLRSTLLSSYDPDVIPVTSYSSVLNINLSAILHMMPEVDPVRGSVKMGIMVTQEWYDEIITWTPADHEGISEISFKSEDVWTPYLTVANPTKFTVLENSWMKVTYQHDGKATYSVAEIIEFSCSFYLKFWPFDKHVCSIFLFPYGYTINKVTYSMPGPVMNTDPFTKNGEWYLDEDSFKYLIFENFGMSNVKYSFKIARQPIFYLLTIIIPISGIGVLTSLVFLLPSESGERVSYSITMVLALAVFLTVISEDLPKNGEPIPVMCIFILLNVMICICGLILVILNLALHHRDDSVRISAFYKGLVRMSRRQAKVEDGSKVNVFKDDDNAKIRAKGWVTKGSSARLENSEKIAWKDVSKAVDKVLFYVLTAATFLPTIIILTYIAAASDYVEQ